MWAVTYFVIIWEDRWNLTTGKSKIKLRYIIYCPWSRIKCMISSILSGESPIPWLQMFAFLSCKDLLVYCLVILPYTQNKLKKKTFKLQNHIWYSHVQLTIRTYIIMFWLVVIWVTGLHANPLARSLGQVKLDSDKWKLWRTCWNK